VRLFLYRLADRKGIVDVEEWAKTLPLRVLKGWMAYWMVEPFGDEWRRSGKLAAVVAGAVGGEVPVDFEDRFLPSYQAPVQTEADMIAELRKIPAFAAQMAEKGI
jgi:hypothetical protein